MVTISSKAGQEGVESPSGAVTLFISLPEGHPAAAEGSAVGLWACPMCRRTDALWVLGEVQLCAACGYSSQGGSRSTC